MTKHRILIVDDDPDVLLMTGRILDKQYEVVTADNGLDALSKLEAAQPDLILADVLMPVMNGWDFVERLRKIPQYQQTPVIFLSALRQRQEIKKGYEIGGDLFLNKPLEPERLLRQIQMQLDERGLQPRAKRMTLEELTQALARDPASAAPAVAEEIPAPTTKLAAKASAAGKLLARILVVDDDPSLLELVKMMLVERFEVITATDGLAAIDLALKWKPDLFIIDWMMPKVSGLQMVDILRRSRDFQQTPIIFISAKRTPRDRRIVEQLQVDSFLAKPFEPDALQMAIDKIIADPSFRVRDDGPPEPASSEDAPADDPEDAIGWQG